MNEVTNQIENEEEAKSAALHTELNDNIALRKMFVNKLYKEYVENDIIDPKVLSIMLKAASDNDKTCMGLLKIQSEDKNAATLGEYNANLLGLITQFNKVTPSVLATTQPAPVEERVLDMSYLDVEITTVPGELEKEGKSIDYNELFQKQ